MVAPSREEALRALVRSALAEDVGPGDVTGEATVPDGARAEARIVQKAPGVVCGLDAVEEVFRQLDGGVAVRFECEEGEWRGGGSAAGLETPLPVARIDGPARAVLAGERTALNFLGHLSGIATLTARYAEAVRGTGALILDTRKTTPGMRLLEKAAVAAGGGVNHRTGLYDAFLIKENHIALAGGITPAVESARELAAARESDPAVPVEGDSGRMLVQVECETLEQLREALSAGADRVLLDNMDPAQLREAVAIRDRDFGAPRDVAGRAAALTASKEASGKQEGIDDATGPLPDGVLLEASGGIDLGNVREIAEAGVDLISVGALTHSAPALDLSMRIEIG